MVVVILKPHLEKNIDYSMKEEEKKRDISHIILGGPPSIDGDTILLGVI